MKTTPGLINDNRDTGELDGFFQPRHGILMGKYYWQITRVFLDSLKDEIGTSLGDESVKGTKPAIWTAYDDDDVCYYMGIIGGDYDGFEPLDDFCMPNAGCTYIKINGERL